MIINQPTPETPNETPETPPANSTSPPLTQYNPITAFKEAFERRWDYKGRTRRAAFWWNLPIQIAASLVIFLMIAAIIALLSFYSLTLIGIEGIVIASVLAIILCIFIYYITIINFSLTIRRFHDIGISGWYYAGYAIISNLILLFSLIYTYALLSDWINIPISPQLDYIKTIADNTGLYENTIAQLSFDAISNLLAIAVFVLLLLDSKRGRNKWGVSEKYPEEESV